MPSLINYLELSRKFFFVLQGAESNFMSFGENEYRFTAEQEEQNLIKMEEDKTEIRLGENLKMF